MRLEFAAAVLLRAVKVHSLCATVPDADGLVIIPEGQTSIPASEGADVSESARY